jgi:hypothetical protein
VQEAVRNLLGRYLILPPTSDLLEAINVDDRAWERPTTNTDKRSPVVEHMELGDAVMAA